MPLRAILANQSIIQSAPRLPNKQCPLKYCQHHLLVYCDEKEVKLQLLAIFSSNKQAAQLVAGCMFHSPFLRRLMRANPAQVLASLTLNPDAYFTSLLTQLEAITHETGKIESHMRQLRRIRNSIALHIALMDCGGVWGLSQVVQALTQTADVAVQVALDIALRAEVGAGKLRKDPSSVALRHPLPQGEKEETEPPIFPSPLVGEGDPRGRVRGKYSNTCGIVIIAMGKHGAGELNYSSDIDLIALFDPNQMPITQGQEPQLVAVKIIQTIVKLLDQHTADGHVFRVDLRLRPDPSSTPLALSLGAAFSYYETVGQNWERAAMIKARAVAGQIELGEAFLAELTPFIWRKYFDYAAIADIHAMKRQIYVHKGHETIAIEGHDIKLGRGGIREIEFFVQTQQLIYGGRRAQLRGKQTLHMLQELQADRWISQFAVDDLTAAYVFLRTIEHRLQMLNDEQTQRLPVSENDLNNFALFCGYTPAGFPKTLLKHLKNVEHHYAHLFESTHDLASQTGSLIFTGTQDDPETLQTLKTMGFANPALLTETIRGWHFGRRKAVTTARARENLTELVPKLLAAFAKSTDPDAALIAFDLALSQMPAAVELFAILKQNPALLTLFAELLGNAPRLADIVTKRPHVLDSLLDPEFVKPRDAIQIKQRIEHLLARATSFEDFLNQARELSFTERFLVGARVLSRVVDPLSAGPAHSIIAEAFIEQALAQVRREIELRYGVIAGAKMAILGLGKLGGREMSAASDLDLIIIYDAPEGAMSDGDRVLSPPDYYARITQRLVTALSAPMARGVLYDIDLRLRPSGRKGPVAVSLQGFACYHATEAETWEHMALTRARCVAGDALFFAGVEQVIDAIITCPRELTSLAQDIRAMRELVAQEKGDDGVFNLKLAQGGLLDIEFIAQYLVLGFANKFVDIKQHTTGDVLLQAVTLKVLAKEHGDKLYEAWAFYSKLEQVLRICFEERFDADKTRPKLRKWLANMVDLPDFSVLKAHLKELQREVRGVFMGLVV
jgi:[glutamine synthetase] adenylyltransferase / [glutamine synthetase]-adenylyl-L-tyrosine phosphorylase